MTEFHLQPSEVRAIAIALDELEAYGSAIGTEDPSHESQAWAVKKLRALVDRYANYEHLVAAAARHHRVVQVPPVRFEYRPTPPSGPSPEDDLS